MSAKKNFNHLHITMHLIGMTVLNSRPAGPSNTCAAAFLAQGGWEINETPVGRLIQKADSSAFVGSASEGRFAVVRAPHEHSRVAYSELEAWQMMFDGGIFSRIKRYVKLIWQILKA